MNVRDRVIECGLEYESVVCVREGVRVIYVWMYDVSMGRLEKCIRECAKVCG